MKINNDDIKKIALEAQKIYNEEHNIKIENDIEKETINESRVEKKIEDQYFDDWDDVEEYEKPKEKVTNKKVWKGIVIGLCAVGLGVGTKAAIDVGKTFNEEPISEESQETKVIPNVSSARKAFYSMTDQEYLNTISDGSHEAWEELPDEIREWIRDPDLVKESELRRASENNSTQLENSKIRNDSNSENDYPDNTIDDFEDERE